MGAARSAAMGATFFTAAIVQRRKLKPEATFESSLSYFSLKRFSRWIPCAFHLIKLSVRSGIEYVVSNPV
jgi:hypothetical protein